MHVSGWGESKDPASLGASASVLLRAEIVSIKGTEAGETTADILVEAMAWVCGERTGTSAGSSGCDSDFPSASQVP